MNKDYSQYSNIELYEMANHLDPYKYQERIEEVQREIEFRKERGEVASEIIPHIELTREDYKFLLMQFLSFIYTLFLSLIGYILLNSLFHDGAFEGFKDFFFAFNAFVLLAAIIERRFIGKMKYLKYIALSYIVSSLITFGVLFGFDELIFTLPF